jgi:multidrug efflux pump subunit AcrA (membrane-fusion protein)
MSQSSETLRNKRRLRAAKLACGVLILTIGWWGLSGVGTGQTANKPNSAPGRVEGGGDVLSLGTSATGTIAELLVKAGDCVQAGQHLVRVECRNIEREREARESDLAASEAVFARVSHVVESVATTVGESPYVSNAPQRFRQVMLSVAEKQQQTPIGLRVSVQFSTCPAEQKPAAK